MLNRMMWDLGGYLAFVMVFILGFGSSVYTIINPATPFDAVSVAQVLLRPFFSIFV
jgi:hypothetical protein